MKRVSSEQMTEYIEWWCGAFDSQHKEEYEGPQWYCLDHVGDKDVWAAMDDSDGNCWVEQFDEKQTAIDWLLGKCDSEGNYFDDDELVCQTGDF